MQPDSIQGDLSNLRIQSLIAQARTTRGFMPDEEGYALFEAALEAGLAFVDEDGSSSSPVTFIEIGAWCGKSTIYLGAAAECSGATLFSIDHHHGSEENQPGWEHHEADLVDPDIERIDTLLHWRRSIITTCLEESVIGVVGDSATIASRWEQPVAFCFIDGGHGAEPAWADFRGWAPRVAEGGYLAIHDVFPNPADGGRPPYDIWCAALESGEFLEHRECGSLRVLKRIAAD